MASTVFLEFRHVSNRPGLPRKSQKRLRSDSHSHALTIFQSELFLYAILLINRIFFLIKGKTDNAVKKQVEIANKLKRFSAATEKKIMRP